MGTNKTPPSAGSFCNRLRPRGSRDDMQPRDLHRSRAASSTTYSTHAAAAWKATVGWLLVGAGLLGWCLGPAVVVATAKASGTELTSIAKIALVTTHERKTHRCAPASDVAGRPARLLPSILLIGERKCGTSSLARYLAMHSHVLPPDTKEPAYLNRPQPSRSAYALHFPLVGALQSCMNWFELAKTGRITSKPVCKVAASDCPPITFDASAGYFSDVSWLLLRGAATRRILPCTARSGARVAPRAAPARPLALAHAYALQARGSA